jgi:hypothetical protein
VFDLSFGLVGFMMFNTTSNNISIISWRSVLLVEETGVPRENYKFLSNDIVHFYKNLYFLLKKITNAQYLQPFLIFCNHINKNTILQLHFLYIIRSGIKTYYCRHDISRKNPLTTNTNSSTFFYDCPLNLELLLMWCISSYHYTSYDVQKM